MRGLQERRAVPTLTPRRRRQALGAATGLAVVVADQVTKSLALRGLRDGPVEVFWTLRLRLTFNRGAAFGLGSGVTPLLVALGVVLLAVLVGTGGRVARRPLGTVALALVVGGAVGNLVDRVGRGHGGAVVDFLDLRWWPVFNLADAAITVGAALLLVESWRSDGA